MSNHHVLPDSRLHDPKGTVMVDWPLTGGGTVRLEAEMIYCANCGKEYGYVPRENTDFACYLCNQCVERWGLLANTYAVPDDDFCAAVAAEMEARFGRHLTEAELIVAAEQGNLGTALEKLARESPFPCHDNRPKR